MLAKRQKAEFIGVHEHFGRKRNEKIGVFLQTLINQNAIAEAQCFSSMALFYLYLKFKKENERTHFILRPDIACCHICTELIISNNKQAYSFTWLYNSIVASSIISVII